MLFEWVQGRLSLLDFHKNTDGNSVRDDVSLHMFTRHSFRGSHGLLPCPDYLPGAGSSTVSDSVSGGDGNADDVINDGGNGWGSGSRNSMTKVEEVVLVMVKVMDLKIVVRAVVVEVW
jgi:hypothetical protein